MGVNATVTLGVAGPAPKTRGAVGGEGVDPTPFPDNL